ncbi:hypothetical protein QYE76_042440 [Lolium multiflorum]|uniref:Retrotransposon protein, putative, Ty1-copia subclass n=1 Tax=Lolium multiflorum TaxID=4521 RepID=A0AAD8TGX6_LOLMU|nr:hypothetical protein QYE76_042440 [Lolium multiflorum]
MEKNEMPIVGTSAAAAVQAPVSASNVAAGASAAAPVQAPVAASNVAAGTSAAAPVQAPVAASNVAAGAAATVQSPVGWDPYEPVQYDAPENPYDTTIVDNEPEVQSSDVDSDDESFHTKTRHVLRRLQSGHYDGPFARGIYKCPFCNRKLRATDFNSLVNHAESIGRCGARVGRTVNVHAYMAKHKALGIHLRNLQASHTRYLEALNVPTALSTDKCIPAYRRRYTMAKESPKWTNNTKPRHIRQGANVDKDQERRNPHGAWKKEEEEGKKRRRKRKKEQAGQPRGRSDRATDRTGRRRGRSDRAHPGIVPEANRTESARSCRANMDSEDEDTEEYTEHFEEDASSSTADVEEHVELYTDYGSASIIGMTDIEELYTDYGSASIADMDDMVEHHHEDDIDELYIDNGSSSMDVMVEQRHDYDIDNMAEPHLDSTLNTADAPTYPYLANGATYEDRGPPRWHNHMDPQERMARTVIDSHHLMIVVDHHHLMVYIDIRPHMIFDDTTQDMVMRQEDESLDMKTFLIRRLLPLAPPPQWPLPRHMPMDSDATSASNKATFHGNVPISYVSSKKLYFDELNAQVSKMRPLEDDLGGDGVEHGEHGILPSPTEAHGVEMVEHGKFPSTKEAHGDEQVEPTPTCLIDELVPTPCEHESHLAHLSESDSELSDFHPICEFECFHLEDMSDTQSSMEDEFPLMEKMYMVHEDDDISPCLLQDGHVDHMDPPTSTTPTSHESAFKGANVDKDQERRNPHGAWKKEEEEGKKRRRKRKKRRRNRPAQRPVRPAHRPDRPAQSRSDGRTRASYRKPTGRNLRDHGGPTINFNQFLEKEKIKNNGNNFTDRFHNLRIFLTAGQLQYVLGAQLGVPHLQKLLLMRSEGKVFIAKNGSFLEKEFLSKEVTGRKVELDEVIEPSLGLESSASPKDVLVSPAPIREEANDNDHETSNKVTTEPRRSMRVRTTPDWYDPALNVMIFDNNDDDPATYEEAMMSPDFNKWKEAMKSEMGSMYDNQVWTLVDLPDSRKAVENKWIYKRKTDADETQLSGKSPGLIPMGLFHRRITEPEDQKEGGPRGSHPTSAAALGAGLWWRCLGQPSLTSRYQNDPGMEHWTTVKNILRYLKRTKDMFLCYGGDQELAVTSYTDASWNTDLDDSKSQSGYVFILNGVAVSWMSANQSMVAKSSTKSEYIVASEASSEAIWMKMFITELGVVPSALDPMTIYCDNMGAIANAQEPRSHKKLKHIKLYFHVIREYVKDADIKICKVHTDLNVADPLTKALPRAKHDLHQNHMGVRYLTM